MKLPPAPQHTGQRVSQPLRGGGSPDPLVKMLSDA